MLQPGSVESKMLLIVVDAKTKWLEAIQVPSTISEATITALQYLFSHFRLPKSLVNENRTGFCNIEFSNFLCHNGITHIRTTPYYPRMNDLAERLI